MRNCIIFTEYHNLSSQSAGVPAAKFSAYFAHLLLYYGWRPIVLTCPGKFNKLGTSIALDEIEQELYAQKDKDEIIISLKPLKGFGRTLIRASRYLHESFDQQGGLLGPLSEATASAITGIALMSGNDHGTGGGWANVAASAATRISKIFKVDVALAMNYWAPPFAANRFHKNTGIPWVLYNEDPWQAFVSKLGSSLLSRYLRRFILYSSSAVAHCTPYWCYETSHELNRPVTCLINAYDDESMGKIIPKTYDRFTVVYTGTIDLKDYDPTVFFSGIALLKEKIPDLSKKFQFVYIGSQIELIKQFAQAFDVNELIKCVGPLAHSDVFCYTKGAHLLLINLDQEEPRNIGRLLSKTPEFIGSGRPILLITKTENRRDTELIRLIRDTGAGWISWEAVEVYTVLINQIDKLYSTGQTSRPGNGIFPVGDITYNGQVKKLSLLLDRVSRGERDPMVEDMKQSYPWSLITSLP